jgi:mutator protein MutT
MSSVQDHSEQHLTSDSASAPSCNESAAGGIPPHRVVEVALAALYRRTASGEVELLVARRHADAIRGGLWEFPGGKIEPGEAAETAALREVEEEVGIGRDALVAAPAALTVVEHSDPDVVREKSIRLHAYVAEVKPDAAPRAIGASEVRWIKVGELGDFEWPKANATINAALAARLG